MTRLKSTVPTGRRRAAAVIPPLFAKALIAAKNCHARKKNLLASGVIVSALFPLAEFTIKPIARQTPFAHDSARRYVERFGCLFHAQTAEEPQLNHPALARINLGQTLQRVVQRNKFRAARLRDDRRFIERDLAPPSSALGIAARAGEIHQNMPHQLGGNREEVGAVLPPNLLQIN